MERYRFAVIFNFDRCLKKGDPTNVFKGTDRLKLLSLTVDFLTENCFSVKESRAMINEIEWFVSHLCENNIIDDYTFSQDEPYVKICGVLYSICETIVDIFEECHLFEHHKPTHFHKPKVIQTSRDSFAIWVGRH